MAFLNSVKNMSADSPIRGIAQYIETSTERGQGCKGIEVHSFHVNKSLQLVKGRSSNFSIEYVAAYAVSALILYMTVPSRAPSAPSAVHVLFGSRAFPWS
jgi:hypothetical protein